MSKSTSCLKSCAGSDDCRGCVSISKSAGGNCSGVFESTSSNAAFESNTGSNALPPADATTEFLNCVNSAFVSSLSSMENPFSASAPICASIRANIDSCSVENRWLSIVLPIPCASVSSIDSDCCKMFRTTCPMFAGNRSTPNFS